MTNEIKDVVRSHRFGEELSALRARLVEIRSDVRLSRSEIARIERAQAVTDYLASTLRGVRAELVSLKALDTASPILATARATLDSFDEAAHNDVLFDAVNAYLDDALMTLASLPAPSFRVNREIVLEAVEDYKSRLLNVEKQTRDAFTKLEEEILDESTSLQEQISEARANLLAQKNESLTILEELKSTIESDNQSIVGDLTVQIDALRSEIEKQILRLDAIVE